jgi:hypothetical protein
VNSKIGLRKSWYSLEREGFITSCALEENYKLLQWDIYFKFFVKMEYKRYLCSEHRIKITKLFARKKKLNLTDFLE